MSYQGLNWRETVNICLPSLGSVSVPEIAELVITARQSGIGTSVSCQKTNYSEVDIENLKKILRWWKLLNELTLPEFRDKPISKKIQHIIVDKILNKKPLLIYSVFCPSYKKGIGEIGYTGVTGNYTKRLVTEMTNFIYKSNEILPTTGLAYFSNLLLENFDRLKDTPYITDLTNNYSNFQGVFKLHDPDGLVETKLLSEVQVFADSIGERGLTSDNLPIPDDIFQIVYRRNLVFYQENLGWTEPQVASRVKTLATSYTFMGELFRSIHKNELMFWTESAYERGRMYSGMDQQDPLLIIYPIKND